MQTPDTDTFKQLFFILMMIGFVVGVSFGVIGTLLVLMGLHK